MAHFFNENSAQHQRAPFATELPFIEKLCFIDILPKILQFIKSPKEKIRLELVSRTFKQCAWFEMKSIRIVCIRQNQKRLGRYYLVNKDQISSDFISSAIHSILIRNRNVKAITIWQNECLDVTVYQSVIETITQQGILSFRKIQTLNMDGYGLCGISQYMTTLIGTFSSQLKSLTIRNIFHFDSAVGQLFKIVRRCTNLRKIRIHGFPRKFLNMIKFALRGKAIKSMQIMDPHVTADDLVEIIKSLDNPNLLRRLRCGDLFCGDSFPLTDFEQRLPIAIWANLRHFWCQYRPSISSPDPNWSVLLRILRLCSQLKQLKITIIPVRVEQILFWQ
jgi:hypothetical protein